MLHTLSRLELLRLTRTPDTTSKPTEGNNLLVVLHVAEVGVRLGQFETCRLNYTRKPSERMPKTLLPEDLLTSQSRRNFTHVLEVRPEVFTPSTRSWRQRKIGVSSRSYQHYFLTHFSRG